MTADDPTVSGVAVRPITGGPRTRCFDARCRLAATWVVLDERGGVGYPFYSCDASLFTAIQQVLIESRGTTSDDPAGRVIINLDREPPSEWGNGDIAELIEHAAELAANGNPAGFFVVSGLSDAAAAPFPGTAEEYAVCRTWIEAHAELVCTAWRYGVRRDP